MYRKTTLVVMVVILSMLFITSCKKDNPAETPVKNLIVTVSSGFTPNYSWTDADGVPTKICRLCVYRIAHLDAPLWGIQTISQSVWSYQRDWYADGIWSPITHGVVQEGAEKYGNADITPLPKNFTYRVKVTKTNGVQGIKDFSR